MKNVLKKFGVSDDFVTPNFFGLSVSYAFDYHTNERINGFEVSIYNARGQYAIYNAPDINHVLDTIKAVCANYRGVMVDITNIAFS